MLTYLQTYQMVSFNFERLFVSLNSVSKFTLHAVVLTTFSLLGKLWARTGFRNRTLRLSLENVMDVINLN